MSTTRGRRPRRRRASEPSLQQMRVASHVDAVSLAQGWRQIGFEWVKLGDFIRATYVHANGSIETYEFVVAGWRENGKLIVDSMGELAVSAYDGGGSVIRKLYRHDLPR